ncbi:recombinase family protein [Alteromonas flava]|uniref:recombinase family protein n=1 Tax=Alteromonas flava TaxID=2048003 RepID=UPI000C2872B4|nr:recombinase family protein [Alteromonas flava]
METYVAYLRVSTKEQGRSGLGLQAQRRDIALFTQNATSEASVIAEYTDVHSGSDSSREKLTEAILHAKKSGATLLVSKLDRLSRKVSFIASLLEDKQLNFRVASMPNADKFQLHIYAALAEQERDFISLRTKAALAEKKMKGAKLGGLRDLTNQRNESSRVQANKFAVQLWPIIEPMLTSGYSLRKVADKLNQIGVRTRHGGLFHAQSVKNISIRVTNQKSNSLL